MEILDGLARRIPGASTSCGLGLPELCSRLMRARLAIGNDSGGIHLAAALGLPSVAVFGSTSPEWTAPRGPRTRTVSSATSCAPCFRRKCPKASIRCLEAVTVEMILDAAEAASATVP
jgi:heptosyltransferase-2